MEGMVMTAQGRVKPENPSSLPKGTPVEQTIDEIADAVFHMKINTDKSERQSPNKPQPNSSGPGPSTLVDTKESIAELVDTLSELRVPDDSPPALYLDLEGVNLSRDGSISILQLYVVPQSHVYLIDVHRLQGDAFTTPGTKSPGTTLQGILGSPWIQKGIFDVRNDSDALYAHFRVSLDGIHDIQLMELASRVFGRRYLSGLAKCIEQDAMLTVQESRRSKEIKERGVKMFAPEKGGSYEVFNQRPLSEAITAYCVQDVQFLPRLWKTYDGRMSTAWRAKVQTATKERIVVSQQSWYNPHGRHKALGPW